MLDERGSVRDGKGAIEAALEPDRRDGRRTQSPATNRARKCSWHDLDIVGETADPLGTLEQCARAILGAGRELRAAHVADHERVPREDEPRFGGARTIAHHERDVLRRVSGDVPHLGHHVADLEAVTVAHPTEWKPCVDVGVQDVLRAGRGGKRPPGRPMVRVHVRVDDVSDPRDRPGRDIEIDTRLVDGINHNGNLLPAAADEVRHGNDGL